MGRPAKTTAELKAAGTYKKCLHEEKAADMDELRGFEPPESFCARTKAAWRRFMAELEKMGIAMEIDRDMLEDAFVNYEAAQKCLEQLDGVDFGVYLKGLNKVKDVNLLDSYNAHMDKFNKITMRFGVSPEGRTKLRIKPKEKEPEDFLKELMGNG